MTSKKRSSRHPMTLRRFTIHRMHSSLEISELRPTSPPPAATYPFGFLSPASSSPEVHPAAGVMRMLASSRTTEALQLHCFKPLRVLKRRASPSSLRGRCRSVPALSPCSSWTGSLARSSCHLRCHVRRVASLPDRLTRSASKARCAPLSAVSSRTYVSDACWLPHMTGFP